MSTKSKKIYKQEECIMCFYNILEDESHCFCQKCNVHSHITCLQEWNHKNPSETDICCHCRQEGHLVKELIPTCSCFGYLLFIRKKRN
jgi:hypothetical protein